MQQRSLRIDHRCPFCGGSAFLLGPSGGLAQNFRCANDDCKANFNDLGPFGYELLQGPVARSAT